MSDAPAFFRAIEADPDDDTPRLVYADWLDEHALFEPHLDISSDDIFRLPRPKSNGIRLARRPRVRGEPTRPTAPDSIPRSGRGVYDGVTSSGGSRHAMSVTDRTGAERGEGAPREAAGLHHHPQVTGVRVTEDALLFAAALADPAEDTPRLVLADWFDEHDEPELASALRAHPRIVAYLGELARWDVSPVQRNQWYDHDREELRDLFPQLPAARLLTRYLDQFPLPPGAQTEYDVNARQPLLRGDQPGPPLVFLNRWQYARAKQIALVRELAARASDKSPLEPDAFDPPTDARAFEFQSCLLCELVLRGCGVPDASAHAERMRAVGHPLAWLPLRLLAPDAELSLHVPRFGPNGAVSFGAPIVGEPLPLGVIGSRAPTVVGSEEFAPESPLFAAVCGWREESNGRSEGWMFRLDRSLDPSSVGRSWFSRLPAAALSAPLLLPQWSVDRVEVSGALAVLFGAAHNGGAHGRREWGAYARLHAWQSLAALAGCVPAATPAEVVAAAGGCEWFTFSGTQWFDQIAWDLGLICVRPDRRTVALLAATDTD